MLKIDKAPRVGWGKKVAQLLEVNAANRTGSLAKLADCTLSFWGWHVRRNRTASINGKSTVFLLKISSKKI
jgi:hypothetical protein